MGPRTGLDSMKRSNVKYFIEVTDEFNSSVTVQ
jgi:hypothetical protein